MVEGIYGGGMVGGIYGGDCVIVYASGIKETGGIGGIAGDIGGTADD
jgi:hypothetical protein